MTVPTAIYKLQVVCDNPMFEGFGSLESVAAGTSILRPGTEDSLDDDMSSGRDIAREGHDFTAPRLAKLWKPLKVDGRVRSFNDYPCVGMIHPAFSRRACDALRDLLETNGELLPLDSESGEYYFYNITTFINALDREYTICDWRIPPNPPNVAYEIKYYAFREQALEGLSIFRLFEHCSDTLVTDSFVRRVHEAGLNGFEFTKVWPFPHGVFWRQESLRNERIEREKIMQLKLHTLVVRLPLAGKTPIAAEKKHIKRLEDELDAQLMVPSFESPYFGSYEGRDIVNNECRLFLSCPDVDRLVGKVSPWLKSLRWNHPVSVMKRYGTIYDEDSREEMVELEG